MIFPFKYWHVMRKMRRKEVTVVLSFLVWGLKKERMRTKIKKKPRFHAS